MRDKIIEVMARALARGKNGSLASDKHWATEVDHFRRMIDTYGDDYKNCRSTITDAFRDAELALTAYESHLQAEGMTVVPVEPTEAMLEAGERVPVDHAWCSPINGHDMGERLSSAAPVWAAMLAAHTQEKDA